MPRVKGDIAAARTVSAGRRVDEGLTDLGALASNYTISRHSSGWIVAAPTANRNMTLPDATTLPEGWEITIYNDSNSFNLTVFDNTANDLVVVYEGDNAYRLKLIDNSTQAGEWAWFIVEGQNDLSRDPSDYDVSYTYTGTNLTLVEYRTKSGVLYKDITLNYTGNNITSEVVRYYDLDGVTVTRTITTTLTYTGNNLTSSTVEEV